MTDGLELGVAVATFYDDDGFLGVQCDVYGEGDAGMPPYQGLAPYGFYGRPRDPGADGKGANVLYWNDGDESHAIALNDPRVAAVLPTLPKGGSVHHGGWGGFAIWDDDAETYTVYCPFDDAAKAHVLTIGKDGSGKPYVGLVHSSGLALTMLEETLVIKNPAGDAYIQLDADGIVLNGNVKMVGGLDVGGGTALPLVTGPALVAWMNQVAAAIASIPPVGGGSAAGTAISTATIAFSSAGQTQLTKGL